MLVLDRRCERLLRRGRSTPIRHSNVPSDRQLRASSGSDALSRHRSSLQRAQPIATHHHRLRGQIAIERAAPSVPHLPRLRALQVCRRRPLVCVAASVMAGIRKPLHFRTPLKSQARQDGSPSESRHTCALPRMSVRCHEQTHAAQQRLGLRMPLHSMTSLAMARSDGGTFRPSAFAALRLMMSSYPVGAWTGSSAGFAPFRIRST